MAFVVGTAALFGVFFSSGIPVPLYNVYRESDGILSAIAGTAQGASNSGGMSALVIRVQPQERAGTLATLYLISYAGAAVPGLIAGRLSRSTTLPNVATGYAVLVATEALLAIMTSRARPRPR